MSKNFSGGATINSGPTLPLPSEVPDGSLFYKTSLPAGLFFFGFNPDANAGLLGDQTTQEWVLLADTGGSAPFVLKSGDTMSGSLGVQVAGNPYFSVSDGSVTGYFQVAAGVVGIATTPIGSIKLGPVVSVTPTGITVSGNTVWHNGNDGTGSGLDADLLDGQDSAFYLNLANLTGTLPVSRGGTGQTAGLTQGGVIFAASPALMASSAAGTSTFLLQSNGTAAPGWVNPTALSVGSATTATTATTAGSAGAVPWSGVTGFNVYATALQTLSALPNATTTATVRPSYFFNMGNNAGIASLGPTAFPPNSISGWTSLASSDMGNNQTGLTVVGAGGVHGLQIAANWNTEESAPTGLRYRVNDDTSDVNSWSAFATLWDSQNFTPSSYVAKSGDTMTGTLTTTALAVGGVSVPSTGSAAFAGEISAATAVLATGGYVQAGDTVGTDGYVRIQKSSSANSGYIEFFGGNDVRGGHIGSTVSTGSTDGATISYIAASHAFTGNLTTTGSITATGNVTAFSDRRLKSNIAVIEDAVEKVQSLNGVTFNRKGTEERGTGLIAQDVKAVLPEAVIEDTDGMMSVAYGNIVGLLVEAIKQQQDEINLLKEQMRTML